MKLNPYLNFDGNAREAFEFYKQVFGGEFGMVQTFAEMPTDENFKLSEEEKNLIMHISLPIGDGQVLMASDISKAQGMKLLVGNNNYISLTPDSMEEGKRLFQELSKNGTVEMPYEKQFWGDYFGSFKDKYGVGWMINFHEEK
ncbi:VOC family protein [Candidatus Microgenomates bacterium]|nr:MAG: VOC family protein [Candidatus Microgenomates bacterium]